jgi:secondary thiamine-phosphate synthase enzyme
MIKFQVTTRSGTEMIDVTAQVREAVEKAKVKDGICLVFVPHTTAGVTINENADPAVRRDMLVELNKIVPARDYFTHAEGNSAGHIKSTLVGCSQQIIVENGKLALGTWQGIYFCEFDGPREREIWVKLIKD